MIPPEPPTTENERRLFSIMNAVSFHKDLTTETERRLCIILYKKWEHISDVEFSRGNFLINSVLDAWESHIKGLGMTFLALESSAMEFRKSLDPEDGNHYAIDPASLSPTYIVIPDDLALKILALEWMP
jgi:hypothetical protein